MDVSVIVTWQQWFWIFTLLMFKNVLPLAPNCFWIKTLKTFLNACQRKYLCKHNRGASELFRRIIGGARLPSTCATQGQPFNETPFIRHASQNTPAPLFLNASPFIHAYMQWASFFCSTLILLSVFTLGALYLSLKLKTGRCSEFTTGKGWE